MTDLKYLVRNVLSILNGKVPKRHCSKMLPCVSSQLAFREIDENAA